MTIMNINFDLIFYGAWALTAIFIIPVTIALELMICQVCRKKWPRLIPVVIGVAMAGPAEWLMWAFGTGIHWVVLSVALVISCAGSATGWFVYRKMK